MICDRFLYKQMTNQEKLLSAFKERRIDDFRKLLEYEDVDIDYFYGEPDNGTLLDLAYRSPKTERYIFELIRNGAKVWHHDEETGKLLIHDIFNSSDEYLLCSVWDGVYSSSRSGNDNANVMKVAVEENDIEAITLLAHSYFIVKDRFDDDRPGSRKHLVLLQGSIDAVQVFIDYFDVDKEFQKDSQGRVFSCREIILQKYPELEEYLPKRTPSELQEILFLYLDKRVPELFVKRIADIGAEILNDGVNKFTGLTYLHVACEHNYIDVVDALLKKNVHLNEVISNYCPRLKNITPIMVAVFRGHYEIFKKLSIIPEVELQNAGGSGSVLHLVLHGMQFMQDRNFSADGHRKILLELHKFCDTDTLIIDHTDKSNRTALHFAFKYNNEFAINLLLEAGAKLYSKDQSILTSISAAILERYFDDCIRLSKDYIFMGDEDNPIEFHLKIFSQLDLYSIATKSRWDFYARIESATEMRKLYEHPLTKSFLYLKLRLVKQYYYINLLFYLCFYFALNTYIFLIQVCLPSPANFNGSRSNGTATNREASSIECDDVSLLMWLITLLFYILLILRELCQFFDSIRRYLGVPENWLVMTMIAVIGFLFADETNTHLAAGAILTSGIGLILLLGKHPSLSIYIEIFKTVALDFAKFLVLYYILIVSFAYSFFIMFRNKTSGRASSQNQTNCDATNRTNENSMNSWQDLQISFFKSLIMMTGEFDAANLPLDSRFSYDHVFVILFVFLVTTVFYNLFNGVAVSDTRDIIGDFEMFVLIYIAKLISQRERLAISNPFRNAFKCRTTKQLERGYIFLRNKLFGDEIFINGIKPVYVYPSNRNRMEFNCKNFGPMPLTIVEHAEKILEKRKRSKLAKHGNQNSSTDVTENNARDSEHQSVCEQTCNLKLEINAKIAARDGKLLQNVDQRFDKMMNKLNEQTSDLKVEMDAKIAARDEKLLQNVDERFDKINKLLESVLQEVNFLKNKD